ncbi:MAG: hypothetical protein KAG64_06705 [Bacteroidales bacterium]|nr:hypothetical protein [Bacteroidales bacterium]
MGVEVVSYIRIKDHKAWINGEALNLDFSAMSFLKAIYKDLGLKYPKFYKMDELSKLGFIASEMLLQNNNVKSIINDFKQDKIGVILQNSDSTIDVDSNFYDSILDEQKHFPSPALFVYTLPNIVLGEISIRNKFKGENALFVFQKYNMTFGVDYINSLFENNKIEACVGGWFNANSENYDAFLYFAKGTNKQENAHTVDNISKIYK